MKKYRILGCEKRVADLDEHEKRVLEEELKAFERHIADLWEDKKIPSPIHLAGGNEKQLIEIFGGIKKEDYILSTHRGHYHYLLAGGNPRKLEGMILRGESMHLFDRSLNFLTSSIVAGMTSIAAGIAKALKYQGKTNRVWCFLGDGGEDEGHFYEAARYVDGMDLPCVFVIEDNDRSVETPKRERYGQSEISWPKCVWRYNYVSTYPHVGSGKFINLGTDGKSDGEVGGTLT